MRLLASASSFGYLIAIGVVNYAVIALHQKMPALRRPFKITFYPTIPILGMIACWFFVPTLETNSLLLGSGLTAGGGVLYLSGRGRWQPPQARERAGRAGSEWESDGL